METFKALPLNFRATEQNLVSYCFTFAIQVIIMRQLIFLNHVSIVQITDIYVIQDFIKVVKTTMKHISQAFEI